MITATTRSGLGAGVSVSALQAYLAQMGLPVHRTGVIDKATVAAVNGVFDGWDDAPADLATGDLTAHQIAAKLPEVVHYVRLAARGAMSIPAG